MSHKGASQNRNYHKYGDQNSIKNVRYILKLFNFGIIHSFFYTKYLYSKRWSLRTVVITLLMTKIGFSNTNSTKRKKRTSVYDIVYKTNGQSESKRGEKKNVI